MIYFECLGLREISFICLLKFPGKLYYCHLINPIKKYRAEMNSHKSFEILKSLSYIFAGVCKFSMRISKSNLVFYLNINCKYVF